MTAAYKTTIKLEIKFNSISKGQLLSLNPKTTTRTQLFLRLKRTLFECVKAFLSQSRNKGYASFLVETLQFPIASSHIISLRLLTEALSWPQPA